LFAFAASAAEAAPQFSARASSQSGAAKADSERETIFGWVERVILAKFTGEATAPVAKQKRPQAPAQPECEDAKKAEEQKQAEAKPGVQAGPEPMYLAF